MPNQNAQNLGGASWRSHHGTNETPPFQSLASGLIVVPENGIFSAGVPAAASAEDRDPTGEAIAVSHPAGDGLRRSRIAASGRGEKAAPGSQLNTPSEKLSAPHGSNRQMGQRPAPRHFSSLLSGGAWAVKSPSPGKRPVGAILYVLPCDFSQPRAAHGACQDSPARWPSCPGRGGRLRSPPQSRKRPTRAS